MATITKNASMPRVINIVLGAWLFLSAFLWTHSSEQMTNSWIMGLITIVFALVAMYVDQRARYVDTIVAVWLFISAFALPHISAGEVWNNVIVAILLFLTSLAPGGAEQPRIGGPRHAS